MAFQFQVELRADPAGTWTGDGIPVRANAVSPRSMVCKFIEFLQLVAVFLTKSSVLNQMTQAKVVSKEMKLSGIC